MSNNEYLLVIKTAIEMLSNSETYWKEVVKKYEDDGQEAEFSRGMMLGYRSSVALLLYLSDEKSVK